MDIQGSQVRAAGVNDNAATNGYLVRVSADGKRVGVVGGGGYRPPPGGGGTAPPYGIALFSTDDVNSLTGVVEVGAYPHDLAFHPVLDIGVAEQSARPPTLHVFNSKSLAQINTIPVAPPGGGPRRAPAAGPQIPGRLLTFGARGTKVLYYDHSSGGALRSIPLQLSEKDRQALDKAYGK
jgi:hypothetical protein